MLYRVLFKPRPIVLIGIGLLLAVIVLLAYLFNAALMRPTPAQAQPSEGAQEELESGALEPDVLERVDTQRSAIAASEVQTASAPSADGTATEPPPVVVRVVAEAHPWLDRSARSARATLVHTAAGGEPTKISFRLADVGGWRFELKAPPQSVDEFSSVELVRLRAEPVALVRLPADPADPSAPTFELTVALATGATLVWADTVPFEARVPVDVAFGGLFAPPSREIYSRLQRDGLVEVLRSVELPLVLPPPLNPESVWVGAKGRVWRAFDVAPGAERIEVALERAAGIRVLHDFPRTIGSRVIVSAFEVGNDEARLITDAGPHVFAERPPLRHRVWLERTADDRVSPVVVVDAIAGETVDVDLRAESLRETRGAVRIVVIADRELIAAHDREYRVQLLRPAPDGSQWSWEWFEYDAPQVEREGEWTIHEASGLEPIPHLVRVAPFGTVVEVDVLAGEVQDVEVRLDRIGSVLLEFPAGYAEQGASATLINESDPRNPALMNSIHVPRSQPQEPKPVAAGAYTATVHFHGRSELADLESDPFVVVPGANTVVRLRPKERMRVEVGAVHAISGESITLESNFWIAISPVDVTTGERLRGMTALHSGASGGGVYNRVTWTLDMHSGLVRIEVPKNVFWTFEPIEPLVLRDDLTITLRASPKAQ